MNHSQNHMINNCVGVSNNLRLLMLRKTQNINGTILTVLIESIYSSILAARIPESFKTVDCAAFSSFHFSFNIFVCGRQGKPIRKSIMWSNENNSHSGGRFRGNSGGNGGRGRNNFRGGRGSGGGRSTGRGYDRSGSADNAEPAVYDICKFYIRSGNCRNGDNCRCFTLLFSHNIQVPLIRLIVPSLAQICS